MHERATSDPLPLFPRNNKMVPTPQTVITHFTSLTGIRYRYPSHGMEAQAIEFCRAGFSLEELTLVVNWTINARAKNPQYKISWDCIFGRYGSGNDFQAFQERLAEAQKVVRTRPAPKDVPTVQIVGTDKIVRLLPEPEKPIPSIVEVSAEEVAKFEAMRAQYNAAKKAG